MFIYILRNRVNGKCYVGQDSGSVEKLYRVNCHFRDAENRKQLSYESKIAPAIIKHGRNNFDVLIPVTDLKTQEDLDQAEISYISQYDSIRNGYNILPGGRGLPPNRLVTDPQLLERLTAARSNGAKTQNEKRWSTASDEQMENGKPMFKLHGIAYLLMNALSAQIK